MPIIRDKNARGGSEITGTLVEAPGRSAHRRAQSYPTTGQHEAAPCRFGESLNQCIERLGGERELEEKDYKRLTFDAKTPETERLWNEKHSQAIAEIIRNPKEITPYVPPKGAGWSKAETPAGRKMMKEGDTTFHFDSGKAAVDQLPPRALMQVAQVFAYGAKKYGDLNWARHASEWQWRQLLGSALRHLFAWMWREDDDPESHLPHLAHAGCNLLMLMELIINGKGTDNRMEIGD